MKCTALWIVAVLVLGCGSSGEEGHLGTSGAEEGSRSLPVPVILDTDIGGDIDDTWALAYLLRSPELDLRLVLTDSGDTVYRAKLAARMLEVAGRTDVPIGIGHRQSTEGGPQEAWVENYSLDDYAGPVYRDGIQVMIDMVRGADEDMTLIAIGPAPNLREALARAPDVADKLRFVGMYGSVRRGYNGSAEPEAEWNVRADVEAVRAILAAPWEKTVTPLDTCGIFKVTGARYAEFRRSDDPLARAILENYRLWLPNIDWEPETTDPDRASTTLYDVVAVHLAFDESLFEIQATGLLVTDDGMTIEDDEGDVVRCALRWRNIERLEQQLVERLTRTSSSDSEGAPRRTLHESRARNSIAG
jgi:inosine-uridine nucleoside N-ribohydrolase